LEDHVVFLAVLAKDLAKLALFLEYARGEGRIVKREVEYLDNLAPT